MRNYITIFIENYDPKQYDLDSFGTECVRLGRGPFHGERQDIRNDIAMPPDITVLSRAQCSFYKMDESWYINDDKSANGLTFNGMRITAQQLHDGDRYYVGEEQNARCIIAFSCRQSGHTDAATADKIPLTGKDRFVLGRDAGCDIVLSHPAVSRRHCIISLENGTYYISDNGSMNGVILNGSPLTGKQKLEQMDKIMIADTSMVFCDSALYFTQIIDGVSVAAYDVVKEVPYKKGTKCITNHVSLSIEPGEFVAIIGGSGAGKTTLLNCLSGMADFTAGDILINGESIRANRQSIQSIIGYVPQNDIVYDNLTLERMLFYSAQLRMPKDTSKEEIQEKIAETLQMVELDAHRNTLISKLSGGQKKRASIAVELLASPKLFFLDEPSSGLDPGTEQNLMRMLKRLASTGKTVIMVTHTVQNIHLCDRVICMGNGGLLCYSGAPHKALAFFGKKNMTDIYEELNEHSIDASNRYYSTVHSAGSIPLPQQEHKEKKRFDPMVSLHQFAVMTKRYAEILINSRARLLLLLLMPVILTFFVCIAFQADGNIYSLFGADGASRSSFPFLLRTSTKSLMFAFSCAAFWIGIFNSIQEISKERIIFERERFTGVKIIPYIMSKFVNVGVLCLIQSLIMLLLFAFFTDTTVKYNQNAAYETVWKTGEDIDNMTFNVLELGMGKDGVVFTNGGTWIELYLTTFLTLLCAMCIGLAVSAAVSNDMALVICPICLLPQILFSGVVSDLSGVTQIISNIITCRWACVAYFTSTAVNDMYTYCNEDSGGWKIIEGDLLGGLAGFDSAYSADRAYLFGQNPVLSAWTALFIMSAVCVALAVILLKIRKIKK